MLIELGLLLLQETDVLLVLTLLLLFFNNLAHQMLVHPLLISPDACKLLFTLQLHQIVQIYFFQELSSKPLYLR